jgi:hypothetical protein
MMSRRNDKMSIVDFFDIYNIEHIRAYRHLENHGFWPEGFLPDEIEEITPHWQICIAARLATAFVDWVLCPSEVEARRRHEANKRLLGKNTYPGDIR